MRKRILVVLTVLGMIATSSAYASRARLLVLGSGDAGGQLIDTGSLYYDDAYNVFYNPSYVNDSKNWAIIEKSNFSSTGAGTTAQGGFVASVMSYNLGLYFNRVDAINIGYGTATNMRPIDVLFGGDMGVKWGLGVTYGSNNSAGLVDTDLTVRLGFQYMDLEPFAAIKALGREEQAGTVNHYRGFTLGTRYHWGEWVPYAVYRHATVNDGGGGTWGVGLGRNTKLAEGVKMNYALGFVRNMPANRNIVPVDLSLEAEATSWLTALAGLHYRLYDRVGTTSQADTTTGRLGASFHLGKADLDFAVGKAGGTVETATTADAQVFDVASGFFTAAALSYRW